MRYVLLTLAIVLFSAQSASARVGFQGRAVVVAAPGTVCAEDGAGVGDIYFVTFLPSGISDNGPQSSMTFFGTLNAFSLNMNGRPAPGRVYDSHYINSYGRHVDSPDGTIEAFSVTPAITATERHLEVTVRISNWSTAVGCSVTLDIAFVRRR